jgi:hypothetical protein
VVAGIPFKRKTAYFIRCECPCGKFSDVLLSNLVNGGSKRCKHPKEIKIGAKYGNWTVMEEVEARRPDSKYGKQRNRYFLCKCQCGVKKEVALHQFLYDPRAGCMKCKKDNTTHGHASNGKPSKEYRAWHGMKERCDNPNHIHYANYGGRGITYDPSWSSFEKFLEDVGVCPDPSYTLERIKNHLGYLPGNVKWAPRKDQQNNRRTNRMITHNGETLTLQQWCDKLGISRPTLNYRLKHWPPEKIFDPAWSHYQKSAQA